MSSTISQQQPAADQFVERRSYEGMAAPVRERRQFTNSHDGLSPEAHQLASAIDAYKVRHRRRFINFEEILQVVKSLGYRLPEES